MIFNDSYDKSLFLLLKYDKEDREKIKRFINDIPSEMYVEIKEKFNYINDICSKDKLCGYFNRDNLQFYYKINLYDNSLSIGYDVINDNEECDDLFEINLYPSNNLLNMSKNDSIFLATIRPSKHAFSCGKAKRLWIYGGILSDSRFRFVSLESSYRNIIYNGIVNVKNISSDLDLDEINKCKSLVKKIK